MGWGSLTLTSSVLGLQGERLKLEQHLHATMSCIKVRAEWQAQVKDKLIKIAKDGFYVFLLVVR